MLKAQELGKLNLDDPINKYLSFKVVNPYYPEEPITIRQLATHTSTIKDATQYERNGYVLREKNNEGAAVLRNFRPSNEMMGYNLFLEKILSNEGQWYKKRNFINNKPGRVFEYSNIGAGLAALVLENAVGKPFYEFSEIHIFEALGMSGTHWFIKDVDTLEHTNLYTDKNKVIAPYQLVNYPDGGLITSSHDLAKYLTELISGYSGKGKVLTNEGYLEFFKPNLNNVIHKDRNNGKYNDEFDMGIFMGISAQGQVGHTGGDPGVSTIMFFDSVSKTGKLLLTNTDLNKEGIQELIDIWNTLEAYEIKL